MQPTPRHLTAALLLLPVLLAFGCVSAGGDYGSVLTDAQKSQVVVGKTTKTEILRVLGNPDQRIPLPDGREQFSYIKESIRSQGSLFGSRSTSRYQEFWIIFNGDVVAETGEQPTSKSPNYFK